MSVVHDERVVWQHNAGVADRRCSRKRSGRTESLRASRVRR